MRVLHLMNGLEIGGLQRVVLDLIQTARNQGFDHQLLLYDSTFRNDRIDYAVGAIPVYFEKRKPRLDWTFPARLARRLQAGDYDVLHAHNETAILYGALAILYPRICEPG